MGTRILLVLMFLETVALADPRLFDKIHEKDTVTLVLPDGPCDGKVTKLATDQLTVQLKDTTSTCGKRKSLVGVSRVDVRDIVERRPAKREKDPQCFLKIMTPATAAVFAVGEGTENSLAALAVFVASGVVGAKICAEGRRPPYVIYADGLSKALP